MSSPELAQLEMLAQVDELIDRLRGWAESEPDWEPLQHCRALVRRLLSRVETLRIRLEAPLIVATFGGTGTGKSALVNALVGRECTRSGRQRPTTTRPILVAHPQTELELLGLPLDDFEIVRLDAPLLRDLVLVDCPDPDTTESETDGSNLARLHHLLPYCDVLLYTATQQKYRSARVGDELTQAATGCRLVFVQTCAEIDEDVRDDWRRQLDGRYQVPDIFFVDSLRALREQQAGQRPAGDFRRLQELLSSELASSHRTQIRRANLVDLVQAALDRSRAHLAQNSAPLDQLERALEEQKRKLVELMSDQLREELLASRQLWERRLLAAVTESWGLSPFSAVVRLYSSLGNLIASAGLWRARSSAQMALIGAVQGVRWLNSKRQEIEAESRIDRVAVCGLDDAVLRRSQLVMAGYVQEARLDPRLVEQGNFEGLRREAVRVEDEFLGDAGRRVEEIVRGLAERHSRMGVRFVYELLLGVFLVYAVGRPAYNFFYAEPILGHSLLSSDFYIHAGVFLVLWSAVLVMVFTRRLRRGLMKRIGEAARQLAESRLATGLFPRLEKSMADVRLARDRLEALALTTAEIRREIASLTALGAQIAPQVVVRAREQPAAVNRV
ncbi:MAG TPA: GTPase domain-containing protein [Planctomycetaceae bacterium]|nr:GTPase domain-containing protein [Planctomycetaceae bacterium]